MTIRLHLTSVFVDDQDEALRFYIEVLGFEPRTDEPIGNGERWLTVGAKGQKVELLLEPSGHPAVAPYRDALVADGIPLASFAVDDVQSHALGWRSPQCGHAADPDRRSGLGTAQDSPHGGLGPLTQASRWRWCWQVTRGRPSTAPSGSMWTTNPCTHVLDPWEALSPGAPLVHQDRGTNKIGEIHKVIGDPDESFARADHVVSRRLTAQRISASPMEPRAVLAVPEPSTGPSHGVTVLPGPAHPPYLARAHLRTRLIQAPHRRPGRGRRLREQAQPVLGRVGRHLAGGGVGRPCEVGGDQDRELHGRRSRQGPDPQRRTRPRLPRADPGAPQATSWEISAPTSTTSRPSSRT